MKIKTLFNHTALIMAIISAITSCSAPKNIAYFQDAGNSQIIDIAQQGYAFTVQPHDKLSILVTSKDPSLVNIFNLHVFSSQMAQAGSFNGGDLKEYNIGTSEGISHYTVSAEGTIDFPQLGILKIEGMTRNELAAFIKGEIMGRNLVKDPIVTVEFLNTGVSVLGEVNKPGRFDLNTDVLTLPEAIALAGDLSIQGQRENVMVMRRNGDKIETFRVNLTDTKSLTQSPAFYLHQGDVVYIEPNNIRKRQTTNNGNNLMNISFWLSVASLLTTAAVLIK